MKVEQKAKILSILQSCFIDVYKILSKGEEKTKVLDRMELCYEEVSKKLGGCDDCS